MDAEPAEESLAGGLGNEGRVVRRGDAVRRPVGPWTPAVHDLLRHLERNAFPGAPRVLGVEDGVEWLEFLPGNVAVPPFPAWSASDRLLVSVAGLQRSLHGAVADFQPAPGAVWGGQAPPREFAGMLVCHNDICLENVVVSDDRAAAFIDFDLAHPVDRLWDIAIALRHWVPLRDPDDLDVHRANSDQVARCRMFLAAHDLNARERERTLEAVLAFLDAALEFVRAQAEAGHSGHAAVWNAGYADQNRRSHRWVGLNRRDLARSA